jgi:hypothetical protein
VPKERRRRTIQKDSERSKAALLNHYARIVPERLDTLEPEEHNRVYKMQGLTVLAHGDGRLEAK